MTGDIAHHVDPHGGGVQDDSTRFQDRDHAAGAPENLDELIAVAHGEKDDVGASGSFLCAAAGSVDVIASDRERLSKVASHGQAHGAESEHGDGGGHVCLLLGGWSGLSGESFSTTSASELGPPTLPAKTM